MMRAMALVLRPLNPALARQIEAGVVLDTTDMTFAPTETLGRFPMRLTPLEEVARSSVAVQGRAVEQSGGPEGTL